MTNKREFIFILDKCRKRDERTYDYDAKKMLHTYMNKIAIDEDDQNEVISYQEFLPCKSVFSYGEDFYFIEKHESDQNVILEAQFSIHCTRTSTLYSYQFRTETTFRPFT